MTHWQHESLLLSLHYFHRDSIHRLLKMKWSVMQQPAKTATLSSKTRLIDECLSAGFQRWLVCEPPPLVWHANLLALKTAPEAPIWVKSLLQSETEAPLKYQGADAHTFYVGFGEENTIASIYCTGDHVGLQLANNMLSPRSFLLWNNL